MSGPFIIAIILYYMVRVVFIDELKVVQWPIVVHIRVLWSQLSFRTVISYIKTRMLIGQKSNGDLYTHYGSFTTSFLNTINLSFVERWYVPLFALIYILRKCVHWLLKSDLNGISKREKGGGEQRHPRSMSLFFSKLIFPKSTALYCLMPYMQLPISIS